MPLTLQLDPDVEKTAAEQADREGLPLAEYVGSVVKEAIFRRKRDTYLAGPSFDEILAPVRAAFRETGKTEAELLDLFEDVRDEVYSEGTRK